MSVERADVVDERQDAAEQHPTIDSPATGNAVSIINDREFVLSAVDYWFDGDQFVVRSREFDCFAQGQDLQSALRAFGAAVVNYAKTLQELEEQGEASPREIETRQLLSDRLARIFLEERDQPRRGLLRRRRGSEALA